MKKSVLFSTAIGVDEKLSNSPVFLGGWCLHGVQNVFDVSYEYDLICEPFGFTPSERTTSEQLVSELYPILVKEIAEALNNYHSVDESERYWEIALGSWLFRAVCLILNRYLHLQKVQNQITTIDTHICFRGNAEDLAGDEEVDSVQLIKKQSWNSTLYGILIGKYFPQIENVFVDEKKAQPPSNDKNPGKPGLLRWKRDIRSLISDNATFLHDRDTFIYKTYMSPIKDLRLRCSVPQFPIFSSFKPALKTTYYDEHRRADLLFKNTFLTPLNVLRYVIPLLLPKIFLEAFKLNIRSLDRLNWPVSPKVIYTANGFAGDSTFQLWTAEKTKNHQCIFVVGQHGANYGTLSLSSNWSELRTPDAFLSWGWQNNGKYKANVIRSYNFIGRAISTTRHKSAVIVMKGPGNRSAVACRYFEYMAEISMAKKVAILLGGFKDWSFTIRMHHGSGETEREHIEKYLKKQLIICDVNIGFEPIKTASKGAGLLIFTYDSAGFIEALQNNALCLAVFENWQSRLFDEADADYRKLRDVGILHYSFESLANFLQENQSSLFDWWDSSRVQSCRGEFVDKYAAHRGKDVESIGQVLRELKNSYFKTK